MKTAYAVLAGGLTLVVVALVVASVIGGGPGPGPSGNEPKRTVIVLVDCSISTEKIRPLIDKCLGKLLACLDPNTRVVFCRFGRKCVKVAEYDEVPDPGQILRNGVAGELALQPERGTRPLTALQYVVLYSKTHPSRRCSVVLLTDGENSYMTDDLAAVCRTAAETCNTERIGIFTVASENRGPWDGFTQSFGDRATVCGNADSYDSIGRFADQINAEGR